MVGRVVRLAAYATIASTALLCSCNTRSGRSFLRQQQDEGFTHPFAGKADGAEEKFDQTGQPYEGRTGALEEDLKKEIEPPTPAGETPHFSERLKPGAPIWVESGKSRVIHLDAPVRRVSLGNPELAGIVVLGPRTIMINAKEAPVRAGGGFGGSSGGTTVGAVTGRTLTPEPHFGETTLAIWHAGSEIPDIHTLFVADFLDRQVMLEVTVAEMKRSAMEEFGIDFKNAAEEFASFYFGGALAVGARNVVGNILNGLPVGTTGLGPTYFFHIPNNDISVLIQWLQSEGLATILAQPKLLALSGQNAVFQVGGEIPIRIATGFATDVVFKPFGTIVTFVPRVTEEGDILLTVTPEVSQADFSSPVEGIPSFRTRRASTSSRLRDGETLVIGGLLQSERTEIVTGVPYLQDIPAVGLVFRHTAYVDVLTELVVSVTPHLVKPMEPGVQLALPTDRGPLTNEEIRTKANPFEATRPRVPGTPQ
jgi:Flp pilus assembly secretin CpaC